jgi:hypothetical protein
MTTMSASSPSSARRVVRRLCLAGASAGLGLSLVALTQFSSGASAKSGLPPIRHVFVIVLENESYASTFGNPAPPANQQYLDRTVPGMGVLLPNYYATGHLSNDNYISMVSGQPPNLLNQADCPLFLDFVVSVQGPLGQTQGVGCVYPRYVKTVGNQLTDNGASWKDYAEDMGNIPLRDGGTTCAHPLLELPDVTQVAVPGDGYATRHNPFVYFHSVIDNPGYCKAHVVPLGTTSSNGGLAQDLTQESTTPNFSYIVPNLCNDGHDPILSSNPFASIPGLSGLVIPGLTVCGNDPTQPGGITQTSTFLSKWVPLITNSPAFKHDGMLVITFDEGSTSDTAACCGETPGPNTSAPGLGGPGGGRVGTVVISPFVKPGTVDTVAYNHYSLLGSVEDLFGLGRLGQAQTVTSTFGPDVYSNW